jgi:hypothetical protein
MLSNTRARVAGAAADSLGLSQMCRALLDPNDPDDSEHAAGGVSPVYPSARVVSGPGDPLPKLRVSNSVDSAVERANSGERANRSEQANSGVQASSGERAAGFRDSVGGGREFAGKSSAGRFDYFARKVRLDLVEDVVLNVFLPHFGFELSCLDFVPVFHLNMASESSSVHLTADLQ